MPASPCSRGFSGRSMRSPDWKSADGLIQLHQCSAECLLSSMDPRSVDVTITSPPYNTLEGETGAYGFRATRKSGTDSYLKKVRERGYSDKQPEAIYQAWLAWVVSQLIRVTRGPVWVNHKLRYRDDRAVFPTDFLRFPVWNRVIWWRRGSMAQNCRKFKPSTEEIYAFGSRGFWSGEETGGGLDVWPDIPDDVPGDVWGDVSPERGCDEHVCPWPVEIPLRLVRTTCPPSGTVLDCFSGRGTAGVAVVQASHGRKFIGCDSDPKAFEAAVRYVESEYQRTPLLNRAEKSQQMLSEVAA